VRIGGLRDKASSLVLVFVRNGEMLPKTSSSLFLIVVVVVVVVVMQFLAKLLSLLALNRSDFLFIYFGEILFIFSRNILSL
jgi:predicted membrane chloride channel (bestrophin family)